MIEADVRQFYAYNFPGSDKTIGEQIVVGHLLIGQSGGPTAVVNATLAGIIRAAQGLKTFDSILGLAHGMEGALNGQFHDLNDLTNQHIDLLARTPGAALSSSRRKLDEADYERVLDTFQHHDIGFFAYIGGNGSMWVAHHLAAWAAARSYDLRVVGIPKTVDNDLAGTDHAPGYGSAARFMALAVRDTGLDLEAMTTFDDVVVFETMGRDSGWLVAASALLKETGDDAPHLVYVPEIPFSDEQFLNDVMAVHCRLNRVYVVVGEGVRYADGQAVGSETGSVSDMLGRVVHGLTAGPGLYLARLVRERLGLQTRFFRPGNIGRSLSACVSEVDRDEAWRLGETAASTLARGHSGVMVALERESQNDERRGGLQSLPYKCRIHFTDLNIIINQSKTLPRNYINDAGNRVMPAFVEYARPLIGDVPPILRLNTP